MRQVPLKTPYLLIGSGRVARHFSHYLDLEGIPHQTWSRRTATIESLEKLAEASERVLLLINDSAIEKFIDENSFLRRRTIIHFSGSLSTVNAASAHPLMSFPEKLYDLSTYRQIPFVMEKGRGTFSELLPDLRNPHHFIESELKPLYHALCVMSGNFTVLLWDKVFSEFQSHLGLPREILYPYLRQVALNLQDKNVPALTGPLVRGDFETINKHLEVLKDDPFREVYVAFVNSVQKSMKPEMKASLVL